MEENREKDQDRLSGENWLSEWEDQCIQEWEDGCDIEDRMQQETELSAQKLWHSFQNSASSITQLYRDHSHNDKTLWVPFQNSASRVTIMYKDSMDAMKKGVELGKQIGHHRRTKDILSWLKKKRRHIRKEDLIAYLVGKSPPPRPRPTATLSRAACQVKSDRSSPRLPAFEPCDDTSEPDLRPFRDALALQRLNGAMSNISMGYKSPRSSAATGAAPEGYNNEDDDFHCFVLDEITRRCERKRTSSPDVRMDSPTRKRSRLL